MGGWQPGGTASSSIERMSSSVGGERVTTNGGGIERGLVEREDSADEL